MIRMRRNHPPRLSYPTEWRGPEGGGVEEYIVPDGEKALVLDKLYPFEPVPDLDERMYDLHEEKAFLVREYRVVRGEGMDLLVSPYYFNSGGTVIDWMPPDFKPGGTLTRRIRGESVSLMTVSWGPRPMHH